MLEVFPSNTVLSVILLIGVFLLTLFLLPRIREISLKLGLYDTPDYRSSHSSIVPTFGGVAFYIALLLTLFLAQRFDDNNVGLTLLVSISIVFFIGLKDDLQNLSPKKKFLGQIIAVAILMIQSDFRIVSFHGFLGLYELPTILSIGLSMFFILSLINAYNLIDGIDGMASIVGIVIASSYGFIFYKLNMLLYLAISMSIVSMLFGFLRFNFSPKKKIFMGDTGSLVIGLTLGLLTLKLLSLGANAFQVLALDRQEIPLLILGILFIPVFDIFRVMFIRFSKGRPVFSPDRNHIHHILIDAGLSHRRASVFCGLGNMFVVLSMFYTTRDLGVLASFFVLLFFTTVFLLMFFGLNKSYSSKRIKVKLRNFLFFTSKAFKLQTKEYSRSHRLAFNQKLKRIRILFF